MFENRKACAPEYRDVLTFKKNSKISGIVKICLSCGQFYLISSKKEIKTEYFGTDGEYKSLGKLFKKYKKIKDFLIINFLNQNIIKKKQISYF